MTQIKTQTMTQTMTQALNQDSWIRAWRFAAQVHLDQTFSGTELPYLTHLGLVAMEILAAHAQAPLDDADLAMHCAILHDVVEDQAVAPATLAAMFGQPVADGVAALSKDRAVPKHDAIGDSLRRIRLQPHAVWCVKLADRISNLQAPPPHWSAEKIALYRAEAGLILSTLGEANAWLAARLQQKIDAYPPPRDAAPPTWPAAV